MATPSKIENCYAIQTWYKLQFDEETLKLSCDEIIKIPLDLSIIEFSTKMTPCVVITTGIPWANDSIKIEIETNEGFIIEPIKVHSKAHSAWVYILTLPPKTTGLKNVKVFRWDGEHSVTIQNNLTFEIMQAPYDYTCAALDDVSKNVNQNGDAIMDMDIQLVNLTQRVTALENKAGG